MNRSPNLGQTTTPSDSQQKKIFKKYLPADYRVKLKESEKRDKSTDLARGLKKTMEHKRDSDANSN